MYYIKKFLLLQEAFRIQLQNSEQISRIENEKPSENLTIFNNKKKSRSASSRIDLLKINIQDSIKMSDGLILIFMDIIKNFLSLIDKYQYHKFDRQACGYHKNILI